GAWGRCSTRSRCRWGAVGPTPGPRFPYRRKRDAPCQGWSCPRRRKVVGRRSDRDMQEGNNMGVRVLTTLKKPTLERPPYLPRTNTPPRAVRQRPAAGALLATLMYDYRLSQAALYRALRQTDPPPAASTPYGVCGKKTARCAVLEAYTSP